MKKKSIPVPERVAKKQEVIFEKVDAAEVERTYFAASSYKSCDVGIRGTADAFYEPQNKKQIANTIQKIIDAEAPISRKALMRKVLSAWCISRSGSRVENSFNQAMRLVKATQTKEQNNLFYWCAEQKPEAYEGYRVEDQIGNKRTMDEISSYEIINAIKEVLIEQVSLTRMDLVRETAKKFGYTRLGNVIETAVQYAIDMAEKRELVAIGDGEKISIR